MNDKTRCPICGAGHVTDHVEQVEAEYKGHKGQVASYYQLCDACGSDFAGAAEMRANKRAVMAFRKQVDGLLSGAEIAALRERYKINQKQAARLFGGGPVAFSKYENDDVAHSEAMDKLLRLVLRSEDAFWALVDQEGMTAELRPAKPAAQIVFARNRSSNVIVANFGNGGFRPSPSVGMHTYPVAGHGVEPQERQWK
ncbi:MAG: type II toxin-antitoxin system MqsA family antitoxin [Burkholderiaceae bacterium]